METVSEYIRDKTTGEPLVHLFVVHVPCGKRELYEHRHSNFEIVLIMQGRGVYSTANEKYSICPGDVFVFSSNEQHCITTVDAGDEMILMNLHFEPRYFWGSKNDGFDTIDFFFNHSEKFKNRLPRKSDLTENVTKLIVEAESELCKKSSAYKTMIRSTIMRMLVLILRNTDYADTHVKTDSAVCNVKAIRRVLEYVHKNLCEEIRLADAAAIAGMSQSYFSALFKRIVGVTLSDYIVQRRVELSMQLIEKESELTIMEIALSCGFNNTANFNKAFKKRTGMTPSEYKSVGKSVLY